MRQTIMGVTESKTSPRPLNFLKQLKKTTEVLPLLRVLVLDTSGHPTSAPQYSSNIPHMHIIIRNLGIDSGFHFFLFKSTRGQERTSLLMDSHPFSYETSIFTLGAPHEEVQGRQAKLHLVFTLGELVPSPGISFL